jgi:hypothetical protein
MRGAARLGVALLAVALGCSSRERATTPERAVERLAAAARTGDRAGVFATLGPATRARLQRLQVASRKTTGPVSMKPEDFLSVGWAPPAWEPASIRTIRREGDVAEVEVGSAEGDRHTVHLVREGGEWKVELPEAKE